MEEELETSTLKKALENTESEIIILYHSLDAN